jgi:alpha/beta superfamily hydrolase
MASEQLRFRSRDDLSLEGVLDQPASASGIVVVCHPHPKMGGTMNAPLLIALRDHLLEHGWAVFRFNFRGIGSSEGSSTTGEAEVQDALGALDEVASRVDLPIGLTGWSFGGAVAARAAAEDDRVRALALIAPAIESKPGITAGTPPSDELDIDVPVLVVCGANDDQVDPASCSMWAKSLPGATYVEMKGANHFFWAKYDQLAELIEGFFARTIGGDRSGTET